MVMAMCKRKNDILIAATCTWSICAAATKQQVDLSRAGCGVIDWSARKDQEFTCHSKTYGRPGQLRKLHGIKLQHVGWHTGQQPSAVPVQVSKLIISKIVEWDNITWVRHYLSACKKVHVVDSHSSSCLEQVIHQWEELEWLSWCPVLGRWADWQWLSKDG